MVAGLLVVEAANNLLPALNLPDWTITLIVAFAILGFPIAMALAWAFETTAGVDPISERPFVSPIGDGPSPGVWGIQPLPT